MTSTGVELLGHKVSGLVSDDGITVLRVEMLLEQGPVLCHVNLLMLPGGAVVMQHDTHVHGPECNGDDE